MKATFEVVTADGSRRARGDVLGGLAVHTCLGRNGKWAPREYTVSHAPSGYAICPRFPTRTIARRARVRLLRLIGVNWREPDGAQLAESIGLGGFGSVIRRIAMSMCALQDCESCKLSELKAQRGGCPYALASK